MRTEARSLEGLLGVLSQRISESQQALTATTERLMSLGDEATGGCACGRRWSERVVSVCCSGGWAFGGTRQAGGAPGWWEA